MVARMRQSYLAEDGSVFIPGLSLARILLNVGGQLDRARCPLCCAPLAVRMSRHGPYFSCLCPSTPHGRARGKQEPPVACPARPS
jgi:hypothetical protein